MTEMVIRIKERTKPAENENSLKEMLVTLADAGVEFVVGGGVACVLHGFPRARESRKAAVNA